MTDTTFPTDPVRAFEHAVQLVGGQRATAERLGNSERTVRMLLAGDRVLHKGFVTDMIRLLERHAVQCDNVADHLRLVAAEVPEPKGQIHG